MATSTERFGFTLPSGQDPASIIPLNLNTQNIEKYLGMTQDMLAPLYDATEGTYEVDDIVTHDSVLYKCITAIATPEEFDETKWVPTTAVSEGGGGAGAIEKTQAEYNALTPAQKENGSIYMVQDDGTGDYEYHTNQAETIVVRVNKTTNEIEWFFVDYTFTGGSVEQIPSELTAYLPASTISGNAYDTSLQTMMGYVAINAQGGFGLYPTDYSREIAGTVKCLLKNTDGTEQANTYTDPYEGTGDAVNKIYFMGTEYANTNGGSGGGGEGARYSETVLFEESGSTYAGIKELSDNISNYDELIFRSIYENSQTTYEQRMSTSLIEEIGYIQNPTSSSNHISLEFGYDNSFYRMVRGENDNELNIFQVSGTRHVVTIIGVKYEGSGGGGSSYEDTSLFSGQTASTDVGVTINLDGNISDYDAIIIECGRQNEGVWRRGYIWYPTSGITIGQSFLQMVNANDNTTAYWTYNSDTSITWQSAYAAYPVTLFSIKGIKFGSSSGGGTSEGEGVEIYSEDEYIVGKWIDGKKLYQRTFLLPSTIILQDNTWTTISDVVVQDAHKCIQTDVYLGDDDSQSSVFGKFSNGVLSIFSDVQLSINAVTVRYTKTVETDAPAWGGSVTNNYAGFIDTDNVIQAETQVNSGTTGTYTATEDCYIRAKLWRSSEGGASLSIDGVEVLTNYSSSGTSALYNTIPLKKGQTATIDAGAGSPCSYTVYGITYASGGSSSGSSKTEYLTNEHVVGTWIDGRDVYEKTIYKDAINGRGNFLIANYPTKNDIDFFAIQDVSYIVNNSYINGIGINLETGANAQGVFLDNNNAPSGFPTNFTDIYVTIRYVKKVVS